MSLTLRGKCSLHLFVMDERIKSQAGKVIVEGNAVKLSAMWFHLQTVLLTKTAHLFMYLENMMTNTM